MTEEEAWLHTLTAQIGEHWDNVRVFVSKNSDDGKNISQTCVSAIGNYYAQYGQVKLWVQRAEAYEADHTLKNGI